MRFLGPLLVCLAACACTCLRYSPGRTASNVPPHAQAMPRTKRPCSGWGERVQAKMKGRDFNLTAFAPVERKMRIPNATSFARFAALFVPSARTSSPQPRLDARRVTLVVAPVTPDGSTRNQVDEPNEQRRADDRPQNRKRMLVNRHEQHRR